MRVRYETFCGGRLLKVFEQVDVTTGMHAVADGTEFVDGQHFWKIDEQRVADDVAQAMLADYALRSGPPPHPGDEQGVKQAGEQQAREHDKDPT